LSTVCLSMRSVTENIYCSQLSSVAILLQPEPKCFTSYSTRKGLCSLSLCAIVLPSSPYSHLSTYNGQRSSQLFCVHYKNPVHTSKKTQHLATTKVSCQCSEGNNLSLLRETCETREYKMQLLLLKRVVHIVTTRV
jgi:hypothetical protein